MDNNFPPASSTSRSKSSGNGSTSSGDGSTSSGNGSWLRSIENHQFIPHQDPNAPPSFDTTHKHDDDKIVLKPSRLTIPNASPLNHHHLAGNRGTALRNRLDPELQWRGGRGEVECVNPNGSSSFASNPSPPDAIPMSLKAGRNGLKTGRNGLKAVRNDDSIGLPCAVPGNPPCSASTLGKAKGRIKPCYCILSCLLLASLTFNAILISMYVHA